MGLPSMDKDHCTIVTDHFTIDGRSRAGNETWFRVRELGVALDVGRCPDLLVSLPTILLTHAHLDHALGVPFYAGQRHLQRLSGGKVVVPASTLSQFQELMALHERMEGTSYSIELVGMDEGDVLRLGRTLEVRAHRATHRVPANGYELVEIRHHLKPEHADRSPDEIAALRQGGVEVSEEYRQPLLFYTGDTDRGILERNEALFRAEVLMIECSFVADGHQHLAAEYRHIHFDDIAEHAGRFENRVIVLTHFSRRYSRGEIRDEIRRRCPPALRERMRLALPDEYSRL